MENNELTLLRNCPKCESSSFHKILTYEDFQYYTDSEDNNRINLEHVQCKSCMLLYMNPSFSDFGFKRLMSESAGSYGSTSGRGAEQVSWLEERKFLEGVESVLDIGCYMGDFLSQLPKNVKKYGLDVDPKIIEMATQKRPEIKFIYSPFDNIRLNQSIDLITMFHVFEHLIQPVQFLKQIFEQTSKKTKLLIEIPVLDLATTNDICGFFNAHHPTHFTIESAIEIFDGTGWSVVHVEKMKDYNGLRLLCDKESPKKFTAKSADAQTTQKGIVFGYFEGWYSSLAKIEKSFSNIRNEIKNNDLVIWGGGMHTEFLFHNSSLATLMSEAKSVHIIDLDRIKHGRTWRNVPISGPENFDSWKNTIFIPSSYFHQFAIIENLKNKYGVPQEKIINLYDYVRVC